MAVEVTQQLTRASQRDELIGVQIGRLRFEVQAILDRLRHLGREVRLDPLATLRTDFDLGLVLGDLDVHRWNVKYLASVTPPRLDGLQIGRAMGTHPGGVNFHMLWLFRHLKRMPCMTFLTAALPACPLA
jgi:hypothetical protein